jgi:predicted SnoaL-like aldol condensation-catalyzing enzyme
MRRLVFLFIALVCAAQVFAQLPVTVSQDQKVLLQSADPKLAANKKLVYDFWREVLQARDMKPAPKYMTEDYVQHNPNVPTGRQPFIDFFGRFQTQPVKPEIDNLVTIVAERDLVVLAFRRDIPDPQKQGEKYTTTWFDLFRIKDGKIAEHWDCGTKAAK